jgi:hypothetical protein
VLCSLLAILIFLAVACLPAFASVRDGRSEDDFLEPDATTGGGAEDPVRWRSPSTYVSDDENWAYGDLVEFASAEIADEIRFQKQCFLSYNLLKIRQKARDLAYQYDNPAAKLEPGHRVYRRQLQAWKNFHMTSPRHYGALRDGDPSDITSLFVRRPDIQMLFELKPALLSLLVPSVRLFKVFFDDSTAPTDPPPEQEIEFIFETETSGSRVDDIFAAKAGRAGGVGLKSFGWEFLGANPAEVENNITARLSLYFNDIGEFRRQRTAVENRDWTYTFSDLVVPEPMHSRPANSTNFRRLRDAYNPDYFRIKVVAGWKVMPLRFGDTVHDPALLLPNSFIDAGNTWEDFVDIIEKTSKVMYLNLMAHDINFNNDGSMELNAEYQAYAEGIVSQEGSDILEIGSVYAPSSMGGPAGLLATWRPSITRQQDRMEAIGDNLRLLSDVQAGRCSDEVSVLDLEWQNDPPATEARAQGGKNLRISSGARRLSEDQREDIDELRNQLAEQRTNLQQNIDFLNRIDRSSAYSLILDKLQFSNRIYRLVVHRESLGFGGIVESGIMFGRTTGNAYQPLQNVNELADIPEEQLLTPAALNTRWSVQTEQERLDTASLQDGEEIDISLMRRMIAAARMEGHLDFEFIDQNDLLLPVIPVTENYATYGIGTNQFRHSPALEQIQYGLEYGADPEDRPESWNPFSQIRRRRMRLSERRAPTGLERDYRAGGGRYLPFTDTNGIIYDEAVEQEALTRIRNRVQWNVETAHFKNPANQPADEGWVDTGGAGGEWTREGGHVGVDFMFLGDILDAIMSSTDEALEGVPGRQSYGGRQHQLRGFRSWLDERRVSIMLGSFMFNNPEDYRRTETAHNDNIQPIEVCLADIPISLELFAIWFQEEIIAKNREKMTLQEFLISVFDNLLANSFGGECALDPAGVFRLAQEGIRVVPEFYTVPAGILTAAGFGPSSIAAPCTGNFTYINIIGNLNVFTPPLSLLDYDPTFPGDSYINIILYQARSENAWGRIFENDFANPQESYLQIASRDVDNGVYHLNLGSDKGLVKTISFSRIDQVGLREARIETAGELGSFGQLRERYNATVSLYGNMLFYPGQYVFINPSTVGTDFIQDIDSLTTKLGIGGYFLITKVENIVEVGNFETILTCSWVYSGFSTSSTSRNNCLSPGRAASSSGAVTLDAGAVYGFD